MNDPIFAALRERGRGNPRRARLESPTALESSPDSAALWHQLALAHVNCEDLPEAIRAARAAVSFRDVSVFRDLLARLLQTAGADEEAMAQWTTILTRKPTFAPALFGMGELMIKHSEAIRAIEFFERAVVASPSFVAASLAAAKTSTNLGLHTRAENALRHLVSHSPRYFRGYMELAKCLERQNRVDDAKAVWVTGLERMSRASLGERKVQELEELELEIRAHLGRE